MRYCESCKAKVKPKKKFSWFWFLVLCITGVGGLAYLFYYFILKKSTRCPVHGIKTRGWLWQKKHLNKDE